jgi:hypothetical protein
MTTSTNCFATASAAGPSTARLNAMMPPKAEVGSVRKALRYAASGVSATATPQGLACFTITHAGTSKVRQHSQAASASAMLL